MLSKIRNLFYIPEEYKYGYYHSRLGAVLNVAFGENIVSIKTSTQGSWKEEIIHVIINNIPDE